MTKILLFAALIACIAVPFRVFVKGEQTKARYRKTLAVNGALFLRSDGIYRHHDVLRQRVRR